MSRAGLLWPVIIAAAAHQLEVLGDSLTLFILDYLLLHPQTISFSMFILCLDFLFQAWSETPRDPAELTGSAG
ncbi:UNVERIFIED_ORG: hypothetical protein OKW14_003757 [Pantoea brenneri]|jgi:hypothetical protein|uniref:hypothetical protein n=1 Tax=Enterobacter agglomerans TaxID=549 RepID=UPI002A73BDF9|nr:hypothetical protein [Pantoea agglomerans]MDF9911831.1 hypothetical protein [Pantoea brenneri]WRO90763.1 hypothetical protein U9K49_03005 [Pantoea agglomerans]